MSYAVCAADGFAAISGMIAERGLVVLLEAGIFMGEFYLTLATLWLGVNRSGSSDRGALYSAADQRIAEPALLAFYHLQLWRRFPALKKLRAVRCLQ